MRAVMSDAVIDGLPFDRAFDLIADFPRYPELVDAVRAVEMLPDGPDGTVRSRWTVLFRGGLLRWTESDQLDRAAGLISFEQDDGDFDVFRGRWLLRPTENGSAGGTGGTEVRFEAEFDLGVPSLAPIVDPVAGRVLVENVEGILRGLFGAERVRVRRAEHAPVTP